MPDLLSVENLAVTFGIPRRNSLPWSKPLELRAVDGVEFKLQQGETLGIVGESGCGKSTLARALIHMVPGEGRAVWMGGEDLLALTAQQMQKYRSEIQMVFQDPLASLDPRMTVGNIIAEPLETHRPDLTRDQIKERVRVAMEQVSLHPNQINKYPHEFSGGQCQRIGIARALVVEPKLIICDEPVSALDVSIQAQVINLLMKLQREMNLSLIFIAHDLSVVKHVSQRVMVLYMGRVMEIADRDTLFADPRHPYTKALLSAVPIPDPKVARQREVMMLEGELPSPLDPPSGCVFRTRCPLAQDICAQTVPGLIGQTDTHKTACHFA